MPEAEQGDLTRLLEAWSRGDPAALNALVPRLQSELRRMAHHYMAGERANHPLQTTALINEAYIRLIGWEGVGWKSRVHFFAVASQMMRRILVDYARRRNRVKRGGDPVETTLDGSCAFRPERSADLLALDEALERLEAIDPRKGRVVELRFFGGLGLEEVAALLGVSDRTVLREWKSARAWLFRELSRET